MCGHLALHLFDILIYSSVKSNLFITNYQESVHKKRFIIHITSIWATLLITLVSMWI